MAWEVGGAGDMVGAPLRPGPETASDGAPVTAIFALILTASLPDAEAAPVLDPQNRAHIGLSVADTGLALGLSGGFDSRLTRFVFVDVGGFMSATEAGEAEFSRDAPEEAIALRHGIFVAPGLRVPHRVKGDFSWDLIGRGGFAAVWSEDRSNEVAFVANPAILAGLDGLVRYKKVGLRASGKAFFYQPYIDIISDDVSLMRPQASLEAIYQW